jgi:hypothetical protein
MTVMAREANTATTDIRICRDGVEFLEVGLGGQAGVEF